MKLRRGSWSSAVVPLLITLSVLYVYRIPVGPLEFPPFRLFYLPVLLVFGVGYLSGRVEITRRQTILYGMISFVLIVLAMDLYRMENVSRYGRSMFNHVLYLSVVVFIVHFCRTGRSIRSVHYGFMAGSLVSILISAYWFLTGQLPFPQLVTTFAGTQTSLNYTQFTETGIPRAAAAFFDPNFYGLFLILTIALAFNGVMFLKHKVFFGLLLVVNSGVLLFTISRTSMIGFAVVVVVSAFFGKRTKHLFVAVALVFVGAIGLSSIFGVNIIDLPAFSRFSALSDRAGRLPYHMAGLEAFFAHPLFGCGNDGLLRYLEQYNFFGNSSAHLVYLSWLAKYGLLGALAYGIFLFSPPIYAIRNKDLGPQYRHFILVTYIPLCVMYLAYDYFQDLVMQYFIFGACYSIILNNIGKDLKTVSASSTD